MGWVVEGRGLRVFIAGALVFCAARAAGLEASGIIDTLAGGGIGDGFPSEVSYVVPDTVYVASDGSIFIAEPSEHRVRRIDADSGFIETFAGVGSPGFAGDGGQADVARFSAPSSVAADAAGNVYICDQSNHRIRRVAPNGVVSTVAGSGVAGFLDGAALSAKLYFPRSIAVDPAGNLLIAEPFNQRVRYFNVGAGTVSTVAGTGSGGFAGDNGQATQARLQLPAGVWSLGTNTFLIADQGNHRIRKVESNGIIRTVAGSGVSGFSGDGGSATAAKLSYPAAVAARSDGSFVIADQSNNRVRRVTSSGTISTVAGTGVAGYNGDGIGAGQAQLNRPTGVAAIGNDCLIADQDNLRVRLVANCVASGAITSVAGLSTSFTGDGLPAMAGVLQGPSDAVQDGAGNIYIADSVDNRVRRINTQGLIETIGGTGVAGYSGDGGLAVQAQFRQPFRTVLDLQGNLLILDTGNRRVRRINLANGTVSNVAGNGDWGTGGDNGLAVNASFMFPLGLAIDGAGRIYVADASARRVRVIHTNGIITAFAGTGIATGSIDGPGGNPLDNLGDLGSALLATFISPSDVAVDGSNVYVTDMSAHLVRRIDAAGIVRTLAGTGSGTGRIDGPGGNPDDNLGDGGPAVDASLNTPIGIDIASNGDVFIADQVNRRLRRVRNGIISTIGGNGTVTWSLDGETGNPADDLGDGQAVSTATFMALSSVFLDAQDNALVTDSQSGRVRAVAGSGGPPPTPSYTRTPTWTSIPATATSGWTPTRTATPIAGSAAISGRINYYTNNQIAVSLVDVNLTGPSPQTPRTNSTGNYSATNLPTGSWTIRPAKQGSIGNAVSSLDAARVLQVIAGMTTFTAVQRLACDATGDGSLSALDAVRILQLSAGVIEQLPAAQLCQSDWLFYPEPALIPNQQIVLPSLDNSCQAGAIILNPLSSPASNQNFEGILLGDCTGNWTPSVGGGLRKLASGAATVHAGAARRMPGGRVRVPIYTQAGVPFQSLDLKLGFASRTLTLLAARPTGDAVGAMTSVGVDEPGAVTLSLASARPIDASGGVLMLEFAGDARAADLELLSAQIDERRARVVTH